MKRATGLRVPDLKIWRISNGHWSDAVLEDGTPVSFLDYSDNLDLWPPSQCFVTLANEPKHVAVHWAIIFLEDYRQRGLKSQRQVLEVIAEEIEGRTTRAAFLSTRSFEDGGKRLRKSKPDSLWLSSDPPRTRFPLEYCLAWYCPCLKAERECSKRLKCDVEKLFKQVRQKQNLQYLYQNDK